MNKKSKWFVVIGTLLFYILTFFIFAIVEFNILTTSPPEYEWPLDKHSINFEGIQLTVAAVAFLWGLHSVCGKQKKTGYGVFFGLLLLLQGVAIFLFAWFFIIGESVKEISALPFTPFDVQAGFGLVVMSICLPTLLVSGIAQGVDFILRRIRGNDTEKKRIRLYDVVSIISGVLIIGLLWGIVAQRFLVFLLMGR